MQPSQKAAGSKVLTWGDLRESHRREQDDLAKRFRAEHDW